jgi:hypothetical protein
MDDHHYCEPVKNACGSIPNFTVPYVIVFFGLERAVKRTHCIIKVDTMLGNVGTVLSLISFKFQHAAPRI